MDQIPERDNGTILKSSDDGIPWGKQRSPTSLSLYGIAAYTGLEFFAVGLEGTLLRTTDGGEVITGIDPAAEREPAEYLLRQNYPNPFNPSTMITYELPRASIVTLNVYDVPGREVTALVNKRDDAGMHEVKFDASGLSSGIYVYRLKADDFIQSRKMLLVR